MYHEILKQLKCIKHPFLAYNTNIDNILKVSDLHIRNTYKPKKLKFIKNIDELFSCLAYAMQLSEPLEIPIEERVSIWLKKHMKNVKKRIGGQTGIMSNFLSVIGLKPIIYTPFLSKSQAMLFKKNVLWYKTLKHPKYSAIDRREKNNWIFEYNEKDCFNRVIAKRSNRFIAASRPETYKFRLRSVKHISMDFAILSGFHGIKIRYRDGETYKKQFSLAKKIIKQIKKKNKQIHIEIASSPFLQIRKALWNLASLVNSIGLDNTELNQFAELINAKPAKTIEEKFEILLKMPCTRIHLHDSGYFLTLIKDDFDEHVVKKALYFASICTAEEAIEDIRKPSDVMKGKKIMLSKHGKALIKKLKRYLYKNYKIRLTNNIAKTNDWKLVIIPNRMVGHPRDIVGLGDIASCATFLVENALSQI